jgi:hypothetical protein
MKFWHCIDNLNFCLAKERCKDTQKVFIFGDPSGLRFRIPEGYVKKIPTFAKNPVRWLSAMK